MRNARLSERQINRLLPATEGACLPGPSTALPTRGSRLYLGIWNQMTAISHDNRAHRRNIEVAPLGE